MQKLYPMTAALPDPRNLSYVAGTPGDRRHFPFERSALRSGSHELVAGVGDDAVLVERADGWVRATDRQIRRQDSSVRARWFIVCACRAGI